VSTIKVDTITDTSGNSIPYMKGAVLQVQYTQYTSANSVSISANTYTALTDLTVNITPKSASSIIRLDANVFHEWSNNSGAYESVWFFYRDSTKLSHADAGSRRTGITTSTVSYHGDSTSTPETAIYSYFDAPSTTSQITYKVGVSNHYAQTLVLNRTINDTDGTQWERGISFISSTEIGG
jgi:hypothetical protein